jgi:hypothetical protein
MIIDDTISFFGVYHHNCIFHLNLSKEFRDIYSKNKFRNVILCQKDINGGYLLTQSILYESDKKPYMQSHYYRDKKELKEGFEKISSKIESTEKTFYLLRSNNYDINDTEKVVQIWKQEVRNAIKEN